MITKNINFESYTTAEIVAVQKDGTILCNLRGERKVMQPVYDRSMKIISEEAVIQPICDTNISITNGKFFTLTAEEIKEIKNPKKIENENITERN